MKKIKILLILLTLIIVKGQSLEEIESNIKAELNNSYSDVMVYVCPLTKINFEYQIFEDPDFLTKNCFIFISSVYDKQKNKRVGSLGIYKNNSILWQSPHIINLEICPTTEFLAVKDLDNDNKVEIITGYKQGIKYYSEEIWIFSWDGISGKILNKYSKNGNSEIKFISNSLSFVDLEPDNIYELLGFDEDNPENKLLYKKINGSYSIYNGVVPEKFPRNILNSEIKINWKSGDKNKLSYKIVNALDSKLKIERVTIENNINGINYKTGKPRNWVCYDLDSQNYFYYSINKIKDDFQLDLINPGGDASFFIEGDFLPGIGKVLITGFNGKPIFDESLILTESIIKNSIVPISKPDTISILVDSLLSYNLKSKSFNWIKDLTISNKYQNYLTSAKQFLSDSSNNNLRAELNKLLTDIQTDSTQYLTHESYALLKYNTEYLLSKIPEEKPKDVKSLIEQLKIYNDECLTKGWYTASWAHNVQKIAIDNGIMMLNLKVPASTLIIMKQFNVTMDTYKNMGFLKQEGYDLLRPQNDKLIKALEKMTSGGN